jgi:hypothetical protein
MGLALACASAPKGTVSVDSSVDPSLRAGAIKRVAVFPIRNVRLSPDELREINRAMVEAFQRQNPQVSILGPAESVTRLNESELAEVYSEFLRNYAQSAIPDVNALKRIGASLATDAILQGEVFDISSSDGVTGTFGRTSLVIRYTLVANATGTVLWQSTSRAVEYSKKANQPAPTLFAIMQKGQEKILGALPSLAQ